jgi:hypothetical protein
LYGPLEDYLKAILKKLPEAKQAQRTLVCTWIVELKLNEINKVTSKFQAQGKD